MENKYKKHSILIEKQYATLSTFLNKPLHNIIIKKLLDNILLNSVYK